MIWYFSHFKLLQFHSAPQDYNETQLEVTFTPSQVEQFVSVVIKDDDTYEATESFFGVLSPGPEGGVIALPVVASVLIEDNDGMVTCVISTNTQAKNVN